MGNPNVGKSVVFSRLTGTAVIASNYPGTTVEFTRSFMRLGDERAELIDVPGTYTLEPTSAAEEVAVEMLQDGDVVINVVDATNLERNLFLTLQLLERHIPVIVALNVWDDALHKGIKIDVAKLEALLGVPVVPTVAVTGRGIKELVERIPEAASPPVPPRSRDERWVAVGQITEQVQEVTHRHHTWLETLQDASVKPLTGILIAVAVLFLAFQVIRFVGEGLIGYAFAPIFEGAYAPLLAKLSEALGSGGFIHDVLIGQLIAGEIDFRQSFGVLSTGLYVVLAMVLPYVVSFYLVLGFLEDLGYLPRLAVLLDVLMHRMGLHGYAIIPTMLGLGCNVPAIMATRVLEGRRQRFIAATLVAVGIPCTALQAMILGLIGERGSIYVLEVYASLFAVWVTVGLILNRVMKGFSPELLIEVPPYRWPAWQALLRKLWLRVRIFLLEAEPVVLLGVLVINILYIIGLFDLLALVAEPLVTGLWGLPAEAAIPIVIGFLRKDVAIGLLATLDLTGKQLVIGSTVLAVFFPCVATFIVLLRELGVRDMLKATALMFGVALLVGSLQNRLL